MSSDPPRLPRFFLLDLLLGNLFQLVELVRFFLARFFEPLDPQITTPGGGIHLLRPNFFVPILLEVFSFSTLLDPVTDDSVRFAKRGA